MPPFQLVPPVLLVAGAPSLLVATVFAEMDAPPTPPTSTMQRYALPQTLQSLHFQSVLICDLDLAPLLFELPLLAFFSCFHRVHVY
jgi:hypothetical protein